MHAVAEIQLPRRIAAPAPEIEERHSRCSLPAEIDALCWAWARWCETRRFYAPDPRLFSILGRLRTSKSTAPSGGPNAFTSAQLARFHQAITAEDELRRAAFEGFYLYRVKPMKRLAAALGVDRTHVYRMRGEVARRAYARTLQG